MEKCENEKRKKKQKNEKKNYIAKKTKIENRIICL